MERKNKLLKREELENLNIRHFSFQHEKGDKSQSGQKARNSLIYSYASGKNFVTFQWSRRN